MKTSLSKPFTDTPNLEAVANLDFKISCYKDIHEMQKQMLSLNLPKDKTYIASEFANNIIDNKEIGNIHVNGKEVMSEVISDKYEDVLEKIENVKQSIEKNGMGNLKEQVSSRGFGFYTILFANWRLEIRKISEKKFQIIATRSSDTEVL